MRLAVRHVAIHQVVAANAWPPYAPSNEPPASTGLCGVVASYTTVLVYSVPHVTLESRFRYLAASMTMKSLMSAAFVSWPPPAADASLGRTPADAGTRLSISVVVLATDAQVAVGGVRQIERH